MTYTTQIKELEKSLNKQENDRLFSNRQTIFKAARNYLSLLKALEIGTHKIVPVEPTEEMFHASWEAYRNMESMNYAVKEAINAAPEYSFDE